MIQVFLDHIQQNKLWNITDRLLLAVSGGPDSMALLHLCWRAGFVLEVGHINYRLRGEDSDLDQATVQAYCLERNIPFHAYSVSDAELASLQSANLQDKARRIRYSWLEELRIARGLDFLVTAHHAQDQAETFLWHAIRGTGVRGLAGIGDRQKFIRRPLLCVQPQALMNWLNTENISWRMDASNTEVKYTRNKIRHRVLPILHDIWPNATPHLGEASAEVGRILPFLDQSWKDFRQKHEHNLAGFHFFRSVQWIVDSTTAWMLSWWLKPLGFSTSQLQDIRQAILSSETKQFVVPGVLKIWVNRSYLWFYEESEPKKTDTFSSQVFHEGIQHIEIQSKDTPSVVVTQVDSHQLRWPLTLRTRKAGDRISFPYGKKKVSDVFIDRKVPVFLRDSWPLLVDRDDMVRWIPGLDIDPSILATDTTQETVNFFAEPWRMP